ncbi:hypothetical protein HU200_050405 [Digitaria exilis]|uniref:Gnk2-homologous domain-containing protein n=1 Tax=Digitaria exilis TaxID=1010633 RepID=A0A835AXH4_9POAL|nr:hypothetical protein HU200_050405 [Digitaria exilis]
MATMLLLLFFVAAASTAPVTRYGEAAPLVTPFHYNCNTTSAPRLDRTNTTFEANLEKLSTIVPANASASGGFFVGSLGAAPDTVFALALCRGDTIGADCTVCLESAFQNAIDYCSNAWDVSRVTIYQERCQVRFSDLDFLDDRDFFASDLIYDAWNPDSISVPMFPGIDPNDTQSITFVAATVSMLMRETAMLAAFNASQRFATALMDTGGAFPTLYSMAQCTPDFSPAECFACLDVIVQMIPTDKGRRGGRIMGLRCSIRYESDVFYGGKAMWIFGSTLRDGM